jgi:hypothetical protein
LAISEAKAFIGKDLGKPVRLGDMAGLLARRCANSTRSIARRYPDSNAKWKVAATPMRVILWHAARRSYYRFSL